MSPELKALVEKTAQAIHAARFTRVGREVQAMDNSDREYSMYLAFAAIRCVAEATREASEGALDSAVAFALNVKISGEYGWTAYMRDLHRAMHAASVLGEALNHE